MADPPQSAFQQFWDHPAGPKTVFFWAPTIKWGLVIAGLGDLITMAAKNISVAQSCSLLITGLIWSRYSLVIIPKNWNLFSVNIFVALTQGMQFARAINYNYLEDNPAEGGGGDGGGGGGGGD